MASHSDPTLLFSIPGIKAYHIENGDESELNYSGPQTLSLLMVPTTSSIRASGGGMEEDFYLHLNLPPELDLPLPATTQIYHQPPRSYLIPRWDMSTESGAFTRIEFPAVGGGVRQEDIDTFETILAQCTAFLERAAPPSSKGPKAYNPAEFSPGEGYATGTGSHQGGQIVLVNEDDGSVVGELTDGPEIIEDSKLHPGEKDPVEITVSSDGKRINVRPLPDEYLDVSRMPQYRDSSLVQSAAAASRLIVTTTEQIGNYMTSSAESFTTKTKPSAKPLTFSPAAHSGARKINSLTQGAVSLSSRTVGQVGKIAETVGATINNRGLRGKSSQKGPDPNYKPGVLNKSMIAFTTIADGIAHGGKHLLNSSGAAATAVVGHRYGEDAGKVAAQLAGGMKNVGLVYIDITGVSRRAVIKSVAKGMVVGKFSDKTGGTGEVVVVGRQDGSEATIAGPSSTAAPPSYSSVDGGYNPQKFPPEKHSYN